MKSVCHNNWLAHASTKKMRYEVFIGEKEIQAALSLMSTDYRGRFIRRIIFASLAVIMLAAGLLCLKSGNVDPIITSIIFGISALFGYFFCLTKLKRRSNEDMETSGRQKPVKATYEFNDDVFISTSGSKRTSFSWKKLKSWGMSGNFFYIEFSGKQFVVIDGIQLGEKNLSDIINFMEGKQQCRV